MTLSCPTLDKMVLVIISVDDTGKYTRRLKFESCNISATVEVDDWFLYTFTD